MRPEQALKQYYQRIEEVEKQQDRLIALAKEEDNQEILERLGYKKGGVKDNEY